MTAAIHRSRDLLLLTWRALAGVVFGAGLSSLADAATDSRPSFGPETIVLFGFPVPILACLFGIIGLVVARRIAPTSPTSAQLGRTGNLALTVLLGLGVLAFVIAGEKRPIVALGWAAGLGFSGMAFVELVARGVMTFARLFLQSFVKAGLESFQSSSEPVREEKP